MKIIDELVMAVPMGGVSQATIVDEKIWDAITVTEGVPPPPPPSEGFRVGSISFLIVISL